jgi:hypothetical protein
MPDNLSRATLNALLPQGSAWEPEQGDDYDLLLDGIANNTEKVRLDLDDIRNFRNPAETVILSDLEKEFGVIPASASTEAERRERLAAKMFNKSELPTYEFLEAKLVAAGFDVQVHANSPAVDPAIFLDQSFQMTAGDLLPGGNDAQAGEAEAYAGRIGGELLVNGEQFTSFPNYTTLAGEADAQAGEAEAAAGNFDGISLVADEYEIPTDSGYWGMIFFVGGDATRNASGELTEIEIAEVPIERKAEFKRLILTYKPMFSWAGLVVVYV